MTAKEIKTYKQKGIPDSVIQQTTKFLEENNYTLFNIALLGASEFRIMYRNKDGIVEAKIFPIIE